MDPALRDLILVGGPFAAGMAAAVYLFVRGVLVPGSTHREWIAVAKELVSSVNALVELEEERQRREGASVRRRRKAKTPCGAG